MNWYLSQAARNILTSWMREGIKINFVKGTLRDTPVTKAHADFAESVEYYAIPRQQLPNGLPIDTLGKMWHEGLRLEVLREGTAVPLTDPAELNSPLWKLLVPLQSIPNQLLSEDGKAERRREMRRQVQIAQSALNTLTTMLQEPDCG
jgi:hypothetical protein